MDVQTRFISATLRRAVRLHDEGYPLCVLPLVWDKLSVVVSDSFGDGAQSSLTVQGFMCSSLWLLHNFHFHTCITGTGYAMGAVKVAAHAMEEAWRCCSASLLDGAPARRSL